MNQAEYRVKAVAEEIGSISAGSPFPQLSDLTLLETYANRSHLEGWASPTTVVQIDSPTGQPLGKSSNSGTFFFPPANDLSAEHPTRLAVIDTAELGEVLVLDQAIMQSDGRIIVVAHIGERLDIVQEALSHARTILFEVTILAIVMVILASFVIAGAVLEPVHRLQTAMEEIGSERLDRRIGWRRRDELGQLAATFDRMLNRLQEAFARERQFISDASHELKTPLTVINANAQMLQRWGDKDRQVLSESLAAIADESAGLAAMVNGMLLLAKADSGDQIPRQPVDVNAVAREITEHLRSKAEAKGLTMAYQPPSGAGAIVNGEENLLRQLLTNLIDNAIKFTETGGITIRVEVEGNFVVGRVIDTGIGIDEASLARVFDRFYRTDKSRTRQVEGTGLGLAIVRSIARVHGGEVSAARTGAGGTAFTFRLPRDPLIIQSQ